MSPSATEQTEIPVSKGKTPLTEPIALSGALNAYDAFDVTPTIGREFPKAKLVEWLDAPNSDELLRDLAITS